jgi:hypothetical protein
MRAALMIGIAGLTVLAGCSSGMTARGSTRHTAACIEQLTLFGPRPAPPKEVTSPIDPTVTSELALFRRPMRSGDQPSGAELGGLALSYYLSKAYTLASFYPAEVRRLGISLNGRHYYAVPAFGRPHNVDSGCRPAALRKALIEQQLRRKTTPVYCLLTSEVGATTPPVPGCVTLAQVQASVGAFDVSDFTGEPGVALVPDGVASVRVIYTDRAPIVVPVQENAILLVPPPAPHDRLTAYLRRLLPTVLGKHGTKAQQIATRDWNSAFGGTYPMRIEWLDSAGDVVRTLSRRDESSLPTSVGDLRAPIEG